MHSGAALHPDSPSSSVREASDSDSDDASPPSASASGDSGAHYYDVKHGDGKLAIDVPHAHDNKGFEATAAVETPQADYDVEAAAPSYDTLYPDEAGVRSRHHSEYDKDLNSYLWLILCDMIWLWLFIIDFHDVCVAQPPPGSHYLSLYVSQFIFRDCA